MNFALMLSIFDPLINWLRSLSTSVKGIIILSALVLSFFCFIKCINTGKNHTERPIKWVMLGLGIIIFGFAIFMGFV